MEDKPVRDVIKVLGPICFGEIHGIKIFVSRSFHLIEGAIHNGADWQTRCDGARKKYEWG